MNRKLLVLLGLAAPVIAIAMPSSGQTLEERIAKVRKQNAEAKALRSQPPSKVKLLQTLMYERVMADFDKVPARDVFDYLRTVLDINLIVRYQDDAVGYGIDPATPITLQVKRLPAVTVLELVLEQCSVHEPATWQLRKGFIEVGTKERLGAESARTTRTYPIGDLLFEPPMHDTAPPVGLGPNGYDGIHTGDYYYGSGGWGSPYGGYRYRSTGTSGSFGPTVHSGSGGGSPLNDRERADEIIDLITTTVEPDAWQRNGGEAASITFHEGVLVIRAPDFVHRQIGGYPKVPPPRKHRRSAGTGTWGANP
ncbi:MAG: hypothetical protein GY715_06220 [Planctomycetes bacterium]|nr:hypothetical protein [Planctomycetota bacterium]